MVHISLLGYNPASTHTLDKIQWAEMWSKQMFLDCIGSSKQRKGSSMYKPPEILTDVANSTCRSFVDCIWYNNQKWCKVLTFFHFSLH